MQGRATTMRVTRRLVVRWLALLAPGVILLRQAAGQTPARTPARTPANTRRPEALGGAAVLVDGAGVILTSDTGDELVAGGQP